MRDLFKKTKYIQVPIKNRAAKEEDQPSVPSGMWIKCNNCGEIIHKEDLEAKKLVCDKCHKHFRLDSKTRLEQTIDEGSFEELNTHMEGKNVLNFPGYIEKLDKIKDKTGLCEGVVTGVGTINGLETVIAVMDSRFMMGSMGSVVGEKITRAIEYATEKSLPIIIFTASGGARMQEGIVSLMQMAKTSAALAKHSEKGLLYITVLTDPTTGGVTASFAMLGDIILAEPGTLIGFAGPRVIEQTIRQKLPEGFQRAEFLLEHGYIDKIVERKDMKETLYKFLLIHQ